jgi:hypothetical protein
VLVIKHKKGITGTPMTIEHFFTEADCEKCLHWIFNACSLNKKPKNSNCKYMFLPKPNKKERVGKSYKPGDVILVKNNYKPPRTRTMKG